MKQFIIRLFIISAVLAMANFISGLFNPALISKAWWWLPVFFMVTNGFLFWLFLRAQDKKLSSFANFFMIATFTKLLFYLAVILIYVFYNRADAVPFIITFFIYYAFFTAYEVITITKPKS